jgi:hypothetical protein
LTESLRIQSLLAQLGFSTFVTEGPNLFYSRRIASLGNAQLVLVPGATKIRDIVILLAEDYRRVSLVLRHTDIPGRGELDVEIR